MSIRTKAILMIMCVVIIVTTASFFAGLFFSHKNFLDTVEQDFSFLILGTLLSVILSGFVVKPYKELETLIKDTKNTAAKLEAVISNFSGIIWNVDRNNVITLLNGLHIKNFGLSPASFEGWNLDSARIENENLNTIIKNVKETINEGAQDWVYDDKGKAFHAHTMPIIDDNGEVDSVVGVIDDISKITQLQADLENALKVAQDANRAKSNFLASMSHEMRTPLNAIIGLSELTLGYGDLNWESSSNLEKIYSAGMTLLSTVNDILDISKIEAGKLELIQVEYDIPSLINDAINQSSLFMGEKPVSFVLDISEDFPLRLYGDDLRVKQILNNLLSNAFKYTLEGTVELNIDFSHEAADSTESNMVWVSICVRDTGMGIRNEDIQNLFIDYAQIDSKFHRSIEGTGLGLPITKKILEIMGGSISVESEYGKGSVFTAKFRQKIAGNAVIGAETADSLKRLHYSYQKRRRNYKMLRINIPYARVLVVDDVKTNLDVAKGMLKPYGMQIDCVASGMEAINAIREEKVKYNAVFMDHMMPVMDGIEATRIIREDIGTEYAKTVPIIALTANAIVGNEEMFLSKGFQAFISKPIEIERLDAVLREWVRDKELEKTFDSINANWQIPNIRSGKDRRGNFDRRRGNDRRTRASGIDLDMGIKRFGGDKESFLIVLRSYVEDSIHLLEHIKGVTRDTLADYAMTIHGIKGSSRGICADELGAKAEALERAAKDGNFEFVAANNNAFIEATRNLADDLKGLIRNMSPENPKPKKDKPDPQVLRKLLAACENYDIDEVDEAMEDIENYEYASSYGLVSWLRENVAQSNFLEIKEKLILHNTMH